MLSDKDIISKLWPNKQPLLNRLINKIDKSYIDYLLNRYSNCTNLDESLYRIKHNIETRPICPICGKEIQFNLKLKCFNIFCSRQCANKNPELIEHRKATFVKKYGCEVPQKTEEFINKGKQTWANKTVQEKAEIIKKQKKTLLEKYGDEKYINVEKRKQTCLEKYGVEYYSQSVDYIDKIRATKLNKYGNEHYVNIDKLKQTCLEKYGVEWYTQTDKYKELIHQYWESLTDEDKLNIVNKIKQTKLERYGDENYVNVEKTKQTCLEKYGVTSILKIVHSTLGSSPLSREKAVKTNFLHFGKNNYGNREKFKVTCFEKYGVTYYSKTTEWKNNQSKIMSSKDMQNRRYNTMRKNSSFNSSKDEEECYKLLLTIFSDTIRQYKSDEYPYSCDFYIPSKNLYIEYNGSWTHGYHPYNENNNEDVEKADRWKNSTSKYYNNAFHTWCELDVKKRKIAKDNNLNYIEFWKISEVNDYIDNINKIL